MQCLTRIWRCIGRHFKRIVGTLILVLITKCYVKWCSNYVIYVMTSFLVLNWYSIFILYYLNVYKLLVYYGNICTSSATKWASHQNEYIIILPYYTNNLFITYALQSHKAQWHLFYHSHQHNVIYNILIKQNKNDKSKRK